MTLLPPYRPLSEREADLCAYYGMGYSHAEAAREMGVNGETVRKMAKKIANKLPISCRHPAGPVSTIRRWLAALPEAKFERNA